MRRHTAKGVVSSVKLGSRDDKEQDLVEERPQSKESRSKQRKRKAEERMTSVEPITSVKKQKTWSTHDQKNAVDSYLLVYIQPMESFFNIDTCKYLQ